jgi:hypothetical protein
MVKKQCPTPLKFYFQSPSLGMARTAMVLKKIMQGKV